MREFINQIVLDVYQHADEGKSMWYRLWTLIRKELQSLLREPQTRAILVLPVLLQVL
ncbi:hypothetical protein HLB27_21660, partial [Dickeya dadantii]|nr:hypothetical protein [Dickeya dadantii]